MAVNDIVMGAAGAGGLATYIEDVFSTWLYTGNGSTQTITNGIDLSGKGGLVWTKKRNAANRHYLFDTNRGAGKFINSDSIDAQITYAPSLTSFNSNGFTLGAYDPNDAGDTQVSWTFRKQPKFFDVVTYTGNGANRTISHSLGAVPACIMVKRTDTTGAWQVYHSSLANTEYLVLNTTAAKATGATRWNSTTPTSSVFSLGTDATVNASGGTYVAYLFAHDAGGFGTTGTDNVISCGSFTTPSSGSTTVTLGYEPQWIMTKRSNSTSDWAIIDNMRGMPVGSVDPKLWANLSAAEEAFVNEIEPTATGFITGTSLASNATYIYIAIRRPMKTPTTGTEVFSPLYRQGNGVQTALSAGFAPDSAWTGQVSNNGSAYRSVVDRLRGVNVSGAGTGLLTQFSQNEAGSYTSEYVSFDQNGMTVSTGSNQLGNASSAFFLSYYFFKRAPGFFDVVCYTGTSVTFSPQHNLAAIPDLVICKRRNGADAWFVYANGFGGNNAKLNSVDRFGSVLNRITAATSTTFTVAGPSEVNQSGGTYVAYLFATVAGVSKVGTYTGTGATLNIDAGFTTGARFVMIKRTDSTGGDWYVWDSARGIVAGNDPHISLNTTASSVTTDDSVDADSSGFIVNQLAATNINVTSATYIFLAIA